MLGYSYFTQEDPRYNKKYIDYDTLLLQIDSEGEFVMWEMLELVIFLFLKNL